MLALVAIQTVCTLFVDYQGHVMGAKMERDMRRELLEHYQRLSFSFYDRQRTGQLMTRMTNDLFSLAELYHHGPEDLAIAVRMRDSATLRRACETSLKCRARLRAAAMVPGRIDDASIAR
jgi:ABC-type multidrug transport system fused ATPase/permease subunit